MCTYADVCVYMCELYVCICCPDNYDICIYIHTYDVNQRRSVNERKEKIKLLLDSRECR